jgi:hypothetical protein
VFLPDGGKDFIKVVQIAKQSYNVHGGVPQTEWFRQP